TATVVPTVSLLGSLFTTTGGATMTTGSLTPTASGLLIVVAAVTGDVSTAYTVTDSLSGSWVKISSTRAQKATNGDEMEVWFRTALATGSAMTFTYSRTSGTATGGGPIVLQVLGMSKTGSAAIRSTGVQNNVASGTAPAPVLNQTSLTTNPTVWVAFNAS